MDITRLKLKAEKYGINLTEMQWAHLMNYAKLLEEWNEKINLTAIKEPDDVENKHIIDCLLLAGQPEIQNEIIDVGTGAGLPGIICKIARPEVSVTLMEPTKKRAVFLEECNDKLGLDCDIITERAEEAARKQYREKFGVVTARAVAALPQLCEYCLPLLKPGGYFLAMKGEVASEVREAAEAIKILGGGQAEVREYSLPDGSQRSIVVIKKEKLTPKQYPRQGARIKRDPLSTNVPRGTKKDANA